MTCILEVEPIVREQCLVVEDGSHIAGPPLSSAAPGPPHPAVRRTVARDTCHSGHWVQNSAPGCSRWARKAAKPAGGCSGGGSLNGKTMITPFLPIIEVIHTTWRRKMRFCAGKDLEKQVP